MAPTSYGISLLHARVSTLNIKSILLVAHIVTNGVRSGKHCLKWCQKWDILLQMMSEVGYVLFKMLPEVGFTATDGATSGVRVLSQMLLEMGSTRKEPGL